MNEEIRTLDLFSGIGGFSLGLERAGPFRTVAFCEQDAYAQRVLRKHWPEVPIYDDVRTIDTDGLGRIDLICGGFPCQPWSVAGQQRGAEDDRDLWPAMVALVEELRPNWLIGENVRGFVNEPLGLQRSLSDLARIGYSAVPFIIPACAVDAPHRRDRVWIIANAAQLQRNGSGEYSEQSGRQVPQLRKRSGEEPVADADNADRRRGAQRRQSGNGESALHGEVGATVADATSEGLEGRQKPETTRQPLAVPASSGKHREDVSDTRRGCGKGPRSEFSGKSAPIRWLPEPDAGRVAHGVPSRVDRLKCLGNAVVPQVVEQIGRAILEGQRR